MVTSHIQKQAVVISKDWHSPEIKVTIRDVGIQLECKLDDFIAALANEMQHPLVAMTKGRLASQLAMAKNVVLDKLKQASINVV